MKVGMIIGKSTPKRSGVENYIFNLVRGLKSKIPDDLTLITSADNRAFGEIPRIVPRYPFPVHISLFWGQTLSLQKKILSEFDVIHNPSHYFLFKKPGRKYVSTIHDLTSILYPQWHPWWRTLVSGTALSRMIVQSDRIIANSRQTKNDIISHYNISSDRVSVTYLGASDEFRPLDTQTTDAVRKKYHLDHPFVLYVGNLEPRKNLPSLIRAIARCRVQHPYLQLVIAGRYGWMYADIFRTVTELHLEKSVRFLDYVPDSDLPALYNAAIIFVYVPFYEGFGIPVLEAMQCGTPVITSNTSSLPEVAGDGGIMVNPLDVNGIAEKISMLVSDDDAMEENSRYNLTQCRKFSWEKCTDQTLDVYREVSEG